MAKISLTSYPRVNPDRCTLTLESEGEGGGSASLNMSEYDARNLAIKLAEMANAMERNKQIIALASPKDLPKA